MSKRKIPALDYESLERPFKRPKFVVKYFLHQDLLEIVFSYLDFMTIQRKIPYICKDWNHNYLALLRSIDIEQTTFNLYHQKYFNRFIERITERGEKVSRFSFTNSTPKSSGYLSFQTLSEWLVKRGNQLTYLGLSRCENVTPSTFRAISEYCHNLKELYLDNCYYVDDDNMELICKSNSSLESLTVLCDKKLHLTFLNFCNALKNLRISYLPSAELVKINVNVEHVHVEYFERDSKNIIHELFPAAKTNVVSYSEEYYLQRHHEHIPINMDYYYE